MRKTILRQALLGALLLPLFFATPSDAAAQKRGDRDRGGVEVGLEVTFSIGDQAQIREFYTAHTSGSAEALPPGIRKKLARGKPLPPGIAKRFPPDELRTRLSVPREYDLIEVGLDVLLVEVATGIIHDVLMDVIR